MPENKTKKSTQQDPSAPQPVEVKARVKHGPLKGRKVTVLLEADDVVRDQVGGFVTFVREHAIVGLAVGFVIGTQAQTVVKQLVTSFIEPAFKLFFGGAKLSERTFTLQFAGNSANFGWGAMLNVLLNLLFVLAAVYAIIKIFNLDELDKKKEDKK